MSKWYRKASFTHSRHEWCNLTNFYHAFFINVTIRECNFAMGTLDISTFFQCHAQEVLSWWANFLWSTELHFNLVVLSMNLKFICNLKTFSIDWNILFARFNLCKGVAIKWFESCLYLWFWKKKWKKLVEIFTSLDQIISKRFFFLAEDSSKIRTKTRRILVKTNSFVRFLEESSAWHFFSKLTDL